MERPIEIRTLITITGINSTWSGLQDIIWWSLESVLATTPLVSMGGDSWSKPFNKIEPLLQQYLVGDTSPLSIAAWALIASWVVHIFLDPTCVMQMSRRLPQELIRWVGERVFIRLLSKAASPYLDPDATLTLPLPSYMALDLRQCRHYVCLLQPTTAPY
jgi:hypothetical protein